MNDFDDGYKTGYSEAISELSSMIDWIDDDMSKEDTIRMFEEFINVRS